MAYVVRRPAGRWELREARSTPKGPRSRTLASFAKLTGSVAEQAAARSHGILSAGEVRRLAARAGAPVEGTPADEAAATLLAELDAGRGPSPARGRMLAAALNGRGEHASEAERAVAPWLSASPAERGEALRDLMLLADRIPTTKRRGKLSFPRLETKSA
jgi:hypothetical protein